jgi:peptidoglycan-associated lipoprotein
MRTLLQVIVVGVVAVASVGCKPDYPNCRNDEDCRSDPKEYCVEGKCQQCRNDKDCGAGQACKAGRCEQTALACTSDDQCPDGQSCLNGACAPCKSDSECGEGGKCNAGRCARPKKCGTDADCAQDEECKNGVCISGRPRRVDTGAKCTLDSVYFDFNEASVTTESASALQRNAECLKKESGRTVQLVGHTDPRGTDEYNLALADRRAQAVKGYLERLGVDAGRLKTLSRGEIDATGTDEAGWHKDRRVDFQWQ